MDVLAGITVVELAQGLSGPLCAMFLGDLGARVIKVEPLQGDWARGLEPHIGRHSAVFLALNRQKESVAVNWTSARGRELIQRLAGGADVCIVDMGDERAGERPPDYAALAAQNPALIYGAITPFGEQGPWAHRVGSELVVQAASGYPRYLGERGQEPVRLGADVASTAAGMFLLQGILASLLERRRSGLGQRVAVSLLGSLLSLKTIQIAAQQNPDIWEGYHCWGPYDPPDTGWRTQDRPIVFSFGEFTGGGRDKQSRWPEFCQAVGLSHLVSDARFRKDGANSTGLGADAAKFRGLYEQAFRRYTSDELIELIRQLGGAAYPYHTYETLFADPQAQALGLLREIPGPEGTLRAVKAPWNFSNMDMGVRRAPPHLGDATGAILSELGYSMARQQALFQDGTVAGRGPEERTGGPQRPVAMSRPAGHAAGPGAQGPLQGMRVVDISAVGVGPVTGLLLAELGADVIKVEPPGGELGHTVLPRQRGTSVLYISANLCKRGVVLDFKNPQDLETAYRLVETSDVFIENFRVGVVERLGLGYEKLSRLNPRLIYCSLSGFGPRGPLAQLPSIDTYMQAFSGFASLNGRPGGWGESLRNIGFLDLNTSAIAVPGILAALLARETDGRGQHLQVAMLEAAAILQMTRIAEYLATGNSPQPHGSGVASSVPDQAFRVLDGYLAVSARTQEEWERLCRALGRVEWLEDPRYRTLADRIAHRHALIEGLGAILCQYPSRWWLRVFAEAHVPCGRFYSYDELCEHAQVRENQLMVELDSPHWGQIRVGGLPWTFSRTPGVHRPGPLPGEHTAAVLEELSRPPRA